MSENHEVYGNKGITDTQANRVLRLIENRDLASLNGLALEYGVATPQADAITVIRRMRNLALGVLEFNKRNV